MGICQSKKEKGEKKEERVTDLSNLKIGKSDFIQSNNGKFKEHY